ncbi:glycosyltransferase family 2 protein [Parascardovia denticolens]|uniref:glycosyltransferase family 2 protein n=1 Tax=Parascardovia denticolens TaxID=78258 RepID=UPI00248D8E11|nr:glycosyltransferase family 2 protein [Parascardovia denticolens]
MTTASGHPLVSIITPVYNTPKELFLACKNSVLGQTLTDFEWLLLDDASDGETAAMLDEVEQEDPRIHVHHLPHGGASKARNFGLDTCRGRYITFVDADDTIEPIFLEHASHAMQSNNADIAIGRLDYLQSGAPKPAIYSGDDREKVLSGHELCVFLRFTIAGIPLRGYSRSDYFGIRPHPVAPRLYSNELIQYLRFSTDMTLAEDGLFGSMAIQIAQRVVLINEIWYWYTQSEDSTTKKIDLPNVVRQFKSFDQYCQSGIRGGWQESDLGVRIYSELNYRWSHNSTRLSYFELRRCLRAITRIRSFHLVQKISLRQYNFSIPGLIACNLVKRGMINLLALFYKFSSILHSISSFKRQEGR